MPTTVEQLAEALGQFRLDILGALTDIQVEITALQNATLEKKSLTPGRLNQLREKAKEQAHEFRSHYAETISLSSEPR